MRFHVSGTKSVRFIDQALLSMPWPSACTVDVHLLRVDEVNHGSEILRSILAMLGEHFGFRNFGRTFLILRH